MQKIMKRSLALLLAVVLCFSAMPFSAFATEVPPDDTLFTEAPPSNEPPVESSQPEPVHEPDTSSAPEEPSPGPSPEPSQKPEPSPAPVEQPVETPEPSAEPADEPESIYDTELGSIDAQQVWPALQRARVRAAAGVGTGGVLQMGYYCFKSEVGSLATLGEYVSQLPAKTMLMNGTNIAAYCLEHQKGATGGTPYTWVDLSVNAQDTVGTILALGFQWNASDFWFGPSDNGDKWAVTQLLIWETINGHAFMQGNGLFGVEAAVDADMEKCAPHAYNPTKFMEYYRDLKKRLNDYMLRLFAFRKSQDEQELPRCGHLDLLAFEIPDFLFQHPADCRVFFLLHSPFYETLVVVKAFTGIQAGDLQAGVGRQHHEQVPDFNLHIGVGQHRDIGGLHEKDHQLAASGPQSVIGEPLQAQERPGGVALSFFLFFLQFPHLHVYSCGLNSRKFPA